MSTERNEHFKGFAKLLWQEVRKTSFDSPGFSKYQQLEQRMQLLFAQRAYDLVEHILNNQEFSWYELEELSVSDFPDLTEWPEPSIAAD